VLDSTKKMINCIKSRSFNTFLFQEFYKDMISTHEFVYCTSLRWLSKGNILTRVFVMKDEIKLFSELKANELLFSISYKIGWKRSRLFG